MNKLEEIILHKRSEVASRKRDNPLATLRERIYYNRETLSLSDRIRTAENGFGIIAEFKRRSPSAGPIDESADPAATARSYMRNGAAAISVLTDEKYFGGSVKDLERVREAVTIPLLRKDFIIDEYQLHEAKAYGADSVLLIADVLSKQTLRHLFDRAIDLGLECLVEIHDVPHIRRLDLNRMKLIGINNRNLRTFTVDLDHTKELMQYLPPGIIVISESGIRGPEDIEEIKSYGAHGALIGEYFMKNGYHDTFR
jgi:indole-3-glycerol phosphate synthase